MTANKFSGSAFLAFITMHLCEILSQIIKCKISAPYDFFEMNCLYLTTLYVYILCRFEKELKENLEVDVKIFNFSTRYGIHMFLHGETMFRV